MARNGGEVRSTPGSKIQYTYVDGSEDDLFDLPPR